VEAQLWRVRPSEMMGIEDSYTAFCFDQAVGEFGSYVKHEVQSIEGKNAKAVEGKRKLRLKALLDEDPKAKFAQPTATMKADSSDA
jgi:hypothetical protein